MCSERIRKRGGVQSDSEWRREMQARMAEVGFVAGTQVAYLRAFDRFEGKLDRKTGQTATVRDARRYLSRLKQSGASTTACGRLHHSRQKQARRPTSDEKRNPVHYPQAQAEGQ